MDNQTTRNAGRQDNPEVTSAMTIYTITRIMDRAGAPCSRNPQAMQLGRRCVFCRQPAAGSSVMADYTDGVPGELLRIPHVERVQLTPYGYQVTTQDSIYDFEAAGHIGDAEHLTGQISIFDMAL